jgi:hypothetical protein
MFKINFRIIEDIEYLKKMDVKQFDQEGDLEGFFQLIFNQIEEGHYHDAPLNEGEEGYELILLWFELLFIVLFKLEEKNYVAVKEPESYNTWIEFVKEAGLDNILNVSIVEYEPEVAPPLVITEPICNPVYPDWKNEKITLEQFRKELVSKAKLLVAMLKEINPSFLQSQRISKIISLIQTAENIRP